MGLGEWLGIVLFVVGIPVAWWLGRKNRQRPTVRYGIDERELVRADDALSRGGLEIRFRAQRVERVCRSYLALWVRSGDPISGRSLPPTDPLGVDLINGDRVLSARVVAESRSQINVTTSINDSQRGVDVAFEFLDIGDGFVVEILHEIHATPRMRGSIPGANIQVQPDLDLTPRGREFLRKSWWGRLRSAYRGQAILLLAGGILVLTLYVTTGFLDAFGAPWRSQLGVTEDKPPAFNGWMVALYSAVLVIVIAFIWDVMLRRFRRRVPKTVVANDYEEAFDWTPAPAYQDGSGRSYRVGDMIEHTELGIGVIKRLTGQRGKLILTVDFQDAGTRKLLAEIAPISFVANIHGDDG